MLSSADASLNDVVKTTVFLTDMNDYAAMNEIYMEEFGTTVLPARRSP